MLILSVTLFGCALTYYMNGEQKEVIKNSEIKVDVMKDGPLLVSGKLTVKNSNGDVDTKENVTAFCDQRIIGIADMPVTGHLLENV